MQRQIQCLLLCLVIAVFSTVRAAPSRSVQTGMNIDVMNHAPSALELHLLATDWVRIEFKDSTTLPAPPAFAIYDPYIQTLNEANIKVLMLIAYSSYGPFFPGYSGTDAQWQQYTAGFNMRSAAIAAHYGSKVQAYEIWNEEDLIEFSPSYDPRVPPATYATLLLTTNAAIKKVSTATVVFGGMTSGQTSYPAAVVAALRSNHNAALSDACDGVGVHPYTKRPDQGWPSTTWGTQPYLHEFLDDIYKFTSPLPFWLTEFNTDQLRLQGDLCTHWFNALNTLDAHRVAVGFWFCWSDVMVPPFGVVDVHNQKKPAYYSFQAFSRLPLSGSILKNATIA